MLLPTGFIAGALTTDINPEKLLGPAFEPRGVAVGGGDPLRRHRAYRGDIHGPLAG
ncbi:MAG: hypothetical protein ACLPUO_13780 [Streptosporangiaceae bacterium]